MVTAEIPNLQRAGSIPARSANPLQGGSEMNKFMTQEWSPFKFRHVNVYWFGARVVWLDLGELPQVMG